MSPAAVAAESSGTEKDRDTLSGNVIVNTLSRVFYLATRFLLPPFILHHVSMEEYGIWSTCFILIGYLGMGAFGVSNVYIHYVAQYHAKGETEKIDHLLSTGLTIALSFCLLILPVMWFSLDRIIVGFNIPPLLRSNAFNLIFGTIVVFMFDLSLGAFTYVLNGLQKISQSAYIWTGGYLVETAAIVFFLARGGGISSLLWAFAIRYAFTVTASVILTYRALPDLKLGVRYIDWETAKLFGGYGAIVQVSGILGMFLKTIEKLIAGVFIGVGATGIFDIGEKFPTTTSSVASSMTAAFQPAISRMHALGRQEDIVDLYLRGSRYVGIVIGAPMGFFTAFAMPIIVCWLGPGSQYRDAAMIMALFSLPYHLHVLTGTGSAVFRAVNRPVREFHYALSQLALVIVAVAAGFHWFGRSNMVIAVAVGASMDLSVLYYLAYCNRFLGIGQWRFFENVLWPALMPYVIGGVVLLMTLPAFAWAGTERWRLVAALAGAGTLYGVLLGAFFLRFTLTAEEWAFTREWVDAKLGRFIPGEREAEPAEPPVAAAPDDVRLADFKILLPMGADARALVEGVRELGFLETFARGMRAPVDLAAAADDRVAAPWLASHPEAPVRRVDAPEGEYDVVIAADAGAIARVRPGGSLCVFSRDVRAAGPPQGETGGRWHSFPAWPAFRWLIPCSDAARAAALRDLHADSALTRAPRWKRWLNLSDDVELPRGGVCVLRKPGPALPSLRDRIAEALAEAAGDSAIAAVPDSRWLVYSGQLGEGNPILLHALDAAGKPWLVVKCSRFPGQEHLDLELRTIEAVRARLGPELSAQMVLPVATDRVQGHTVIAYRFEPSERRGGFAWHLWEKKRTAERVTDWLTDVARVTAVVAEPGVFDSQHLAPLRRLSGREDVPGWLRDAARRGASVLERYAGRRVTILEHGDFGFHNMRLRSLGFKVIDWGSSEQAGIVLGDLGMFLGAYMPDAAARVCVERYAAALDLPLSDAYPFFVSYLARRWEELDRVRPRTAGDPRPGGMILLTVAQKMKRVLEGA